MANTNPVVDNSETLRLVLEEASRAARVRVYQLAAVSRGLEGREPVDFAALSAGGAVAFSDDGKPVGDERIMRQALLAGKELGNAISVHQEDASVVGSGVANEGEPARRLGLPEWPCRGEADMVERDIRLLRETGGHLHVAHVSCARSVELIRGARQEGLRITAEVTPHHLLLTDELLAGNPARGLPPRDPNAKVNPPLRSEEDARALVEALADGVIDAVATDHAPHSAGDKAPPFETAAFGFTGLELALPMLLQLVRRAAIQLGTLIERLTTGPAGCFGLDAGTLMPGSVADVCIFDPEREWLVSAETLLSKGKNTPLLGASMRGRVTHALVGGSIVHELD